LQNVGASLLAKTAAQTTSHPTGAQNPHIQRQSSPLRQL